MQPDQDKNGWQQPPAQPSGAPYTPPQEEQASPPSPPPISTPTAPEQPAPTPHEDNTLSNPVPEIIPDEAPNPEDTPEELPENDQQPIRWQAQEYIHHEKTALWFVIFGIVVLALMAAAIFLMQSWTFAILVPVMAIALIVYYRRPPRTLTYTLSNQGLHINDHLYPFSQFKGFGVIHDGKEYSVMLLPVKRFSPGVSVYFPEEAGEGIVDMLGARLPMQQMQLDVVDRLVHKLRI